MSVVNGGSEPLGGYAVSLEVVPRSGALGSLTLTGASDVPGQLIDSNDGVVFTDAGTFVFISDVTDAATVALVDEALFNLAFSVAAGTDGEFEVRFLRAPTHALGSELQDGGAAVIPTSFADGIITVAIPEPATGTALAAVLAVLGFRRRAASRPPGQTAGRRGPPLRCRA